MNIYDISDPIADACIAAANKAGPTLHLAQHDAIRRAIAEGLEARATPKSGADGTAFGQPTGVAAGEPQ